MTEYVGIILTKDDSCWNSPPSISDKSYELFYARTNGREDHAGIAADQDMIAVVEELGEEAWSENSESWVMYFEKKYLGCHRISCNAGGFEMVKIDVELYRNKCIKDIIAALDLSADEKLQGISDMLDVFIKAPTIYRKRPI